MFWVPACGWWPMIAIIPGARAQLAPHSTGRQGCRGQQPHCPWRGTEWPCGPPRSKPWAGWSKGVVGRAHEARVCTDPLPSHQLLPMSTCG